MDAANAWRKCAEQFSEEWGGGWRERTLDGGCIKWRGFHAHPIELRISRCIGAEVCPCGEEREAGPKSKFSGEVSARGAEVAGRSEGVDVGVPVMCGSSKRWRVAVVMRARKQRAVAPVKVGDRKQRRHQGIVPWCLRGVWWGIWVRVSRRCPMC